MIKIPELAELRAKLIGKKFFGVVSLHRRVTCTCCAGRTEVIYSGQDGSSGRVACPVCDGDGKVTVAFWCAAQINLHGIIIDGYGNRVCGGADAFFVQEDGISFPSLFEAEAEAVAEALTKFLAGGWCPPTPPCWCGDMDCKQCWLDWLNMEADNE